MKHYDFDEIIERRGTNCVKYDELKDYFGNDNLEHIQGLDPVIP